MSGLAIFAAATLAAAPGTDRGQNPVEQRKATGPRELSFGPDRLQRLDYWPGTTAGAPLVVFVHGGGWKRGDKRMMTGSAKLAHWQAQGYAVASVNYRLVPDATVEQQAEDVATALAWLSDNADALGFDGGRMALVGHSAGAHLAALVGTDPQWLRAVGLRQSDLAGVVLLDGAAYDVAAQVGTNARLMGDTYRQAFGSDPVRQRALSPVHHAKAPNVPAFLILHVQRADAASQSRVLGDALRRAGTPADVRQFAGRGLRGHAEINRRLGDPRYPATAAVDAFLKLRFGD